MLLTHPEPDWLAGVWAYGPETAEDSDSDAGPACSGCDGDLDADGYCRDCQEYGAMTRREHPAWSVLLAIGFALSFCAMWMVLP
jgi:hypothetical protein